MNFLALCGNLFRLIFGVSLFCFFSSIQFIAYNQVIFQTMDVLIITKAVKVIWQFTVQLVHYGRIHQTVRRRVVAAPILVSMLASAHQVSAHYHMDMVVHQLHCLLYLNRSMQPKSVRHSPTDPALDVNINAKCVHR